MISETKKVFCKRLKCLLCKSDISQSDLARRINVRQNTISTWLNTVNRKGEEIDILPNAAALVQIVKVLDTSADYLLGITNNSHSDCEMEKRDD